MKKVIFLAMTVLFMFTGALSAKELNTNLTNKINDEIKLNYNMGNVSNLSNEQIETNILKFINDNVPNSELTCTVTVSGTVDVGVAEFSIEVSVSGPCAEIRAKGKEIATQILTDVKKAISDAF